MSKKLKKLLLPWLDANDNDKIDWYEYIPPIAFILIVEMVAEFVATGAYNLVF